MLWHGWADRHLHKKLDRGVPVDYLRVPSNAGLLKLCDVVLVDIVNELLHAPALIRGGHLAAHVTVNPFPLRCQCWGKQLHARLMSCTFSKSSCSVALFTSEIAGNFVPVRVRILDQMSVHKREREKTGRCGRFPASPRERIFQFAKVPSFTRSLEI